MNVERFDFKTAEDMGAFGTASLPPAQPKVLRPLRFCEYRIKDQTGAVDICDKLAVGELEGMSLCMHHGPLVQRGLDKEDAL